MNKGIYTISKSKKYEAPTSSSYAVTASHAITASNAITASHALNSKWIIEGGGMAYTNENGSVRVLASDIQLVNTELNVKVYNPSDATYETAANQSEMDFIIANSSVTNEFTVTNINNTSIGTDQYALEIDGFLAITSSGYYYFGLQSDDASDAFINGTKVADAYGGYEELGGGIPVRGNQYPLYLTSSIYDVKVRFQESSGADFVSFYWSLDSGSNWEIVPEYAFAKYVDYNPYALNVTGSANFTNGITGSLLGNATTATTATTAYTSSYPISVSGTSIYSTSPTSLANGANVIALGNRAGYVLNGSDDAIFFGSGSGLNTSRAIGSIFIGWASGESAGYADNSNFIGYGAGRYATGSSSANFIGLNAGRLAISANYSNFIGNRTGFSSSLASYSNLFGFQVGANLSGQGSIGRNNIIIGTNITLETGRRDSINIGGIIFGTGSYYSTSFTTNYSGSADGRIGINVVNPTYTLDVSGSGNYTNGLIVTGSLNVSNGITGSFSGSVVGYVTDSNFNTFSSSINTYTQSINTSISSLNSATQSINTSISSLNSFTQSINSWTSSVARTGSNTFTGKQYISDSTNATSFTSTPAIYTDGGLRVSRDAYISGTLYTNDLIVYGTSSLLNITASQLNISTNLITVNTFSPANRYGGIAVIDSGSSPLGSGSFLYDSVQDEFIFVHKGNGTNVTSSHFLVGPETYDQLGNEIYVAANRLLKSQGNEHVTASNISDTGTIVSINSNAEITGSLIVSNGITGSFSGSVDGYVPNTATSSFVPNTATSSFVLNTQTSSFVPNTATSSFVPNTATSSFVLNTQTSSFVPNTATSSFLLNSQTSSMTAGTASRVQGGTANYITRWTDSTTLSTSQIFQNGSNIGIGTTAPNTTLHISASSAQPLLNIENANTVGYSNMRFTGTGKKFVIGVGNASETSFGVANDFFIYDDSVGAIRAVVDTNGNVGIGNTAPSTTLDVNGTIKATLVTASLQTNAGTVSTPPILVTTGTNLTSSIAGAIEYDGTTFYMTPSGSNRSVNVAEHFVCRTGTKTMTSNTNLQSIFDNANSGTGGLTNGALGLPGATTYYFECSINVSSMSATSGNMGFSILGAGTATFTSAAWHAIGMDATAQTTAAAQGGIWSSSTAQTGNIVTATTGTACSVIIKGIFRINAGGTIIPSIQLTTAATAVIGVNSWFKCYPVGTNNVISVGNWS